ncbi:MAG: helix-turn-helix domain-containing protein [Deltaproteobacteria bacterium]|nr:helix-turn-helix domain-containing protein [Deltaproteobacteria bacterium]
MTESLGKSLINLRAAKGLSADDIARRTKISRMNIENLENDRFDLLPKPVFVRGFIKLLCRELRVEPALYLELYEQSVKQAGEKVEKPSLENIIKSYCHNIEHSRDFKLIYIILIAIFLVSVLLAVFTIGSGGGGSVDISSADKPIIQFEEPGR